MRRPALFSAIRVNKLSKSAWIDKDGNILWSPERPYVECKLLPTRWQLAWNVLIGKYDALDWKKLEPIDKEVSG